MASIIDTNGLFAQLFSFPLLNQGLCFVVIKVFAYAMHWFRRLLVWSPRLYLWPDRTGEWTHLWMHRDLIHKQRCTEYF